MTHKLTLRTLAFSSLLALLATPAHAQNLFVNPGFDQDLEGWLTFATPVAAPPDSGQGSVAWIGSDAADSSVSGGVALGASAADGAATAAVGQCFAVSPGALAKVEAKILTTRQYLTSSALVAVSFFSSADCTGPALARASADSLPFVVPETTSGGLWLPTAVQAIASLGAQSVLAEIGARASSSRMYGGGSVAAVADDAVFTLSLVPTTTWILPSAGWVQGVGGYWRTEFTLCNPGPVDAAVTLKWLVHDTDGRAGAERNFVVRAGETLSVESEEWEMNYHGKWGAVLVTSSSPAVFLQSETSTFTSGGTVGQAVPALGLHDYASNVPKALAPIRENGAYRTNLVLANPTEVAVTAHVALHAADGTLVGTRDVALPPLGMTQINRVAAALGAASMHNGRIAISTLTPSGVVAAYASVIDNATNDPRSLLPH